MLVYLLVFTQRAKNMRILESNEIFSISGGNSGGLIPAQVGYLLMLTLQSISAGTLQYALPTADRVSQNLYVTHFLVPLMHITATTVSFKIFNDWVEPALLKNETQ